MKYSICIAATLLATSLNFLSFGQDTNGKQVNSTLGKKWDVAHPPGTFKEVEFNCNEGSWMNLDVSPDGKKIVFDLLGDIYTMPVTGGEATCLRQGNAFEVQPRYSPDGKKICFTSDAGGGDNVWMMYADGSHAKQITRESFRLLNNPVWTADGQYVIARKHFTSTRSLGAGEMWIYHVSGGEGLQLTLKKNSQQDAGEPCISPDGRYLYYSEDMYPGGMFLYNKDANKEIYVIKRYDRETGETTQIAGGPGGAFRPQVSRDGKKLAFVRRVREQSTLFIQDLQTGETMPVYDQLSKDQQEAWAIFGVYTNFNWLDDKHIIIWAKGKIMNINIDHSTAVEIPFTVKATHRITDALHFRQEVAPDSFTVKVIRNATVSPGEKYLVFNAAGYLWIKNLPDGKPERLTASTDFEFEPSFASSGNELAYTTWNDEELSAVWKINIKARTVVKLTTEKGIYRTPRISPNGKKVVYVKESGNDHMGFSFCMNPGIYLMNNAPDARPELISREGSNPVFIGNTQLFFEMDSGDVKIYKSYDVKAQN